MRLFLTISASQNRSYQQMGWDRVQVIGRFYRNGGGVCYQDGLVRLCRSAHQVFASQPTRLFLHGLYIRGSLIELWVFDRSGLYCSDVLDMQKVFIKSLSIALSYQHMTNQELGRSSISRRTSMGVISPLVVQQIPQISSILTTAQLRPDKVLSTQAQPATGPERQIPIIGPMP